MQLRTHPGFRKPGGHSLSWKGPPTHTHTHTLQRPLPPPPSPKYLPMIDKKTEELIIPKQLESPPPTHTHRGLCVLCVLCVRAAPKKKKSTFSICLSVPPPLCGFKKESRMEWALIGGIAAEENRKERKGRDWTGVYICMGQFGREQEKFSW